MISTPRMYSPVETYSDGRHEDLVNKDSLG